MNKSSLSIDIFNGKWYLFIVNDGTKKVVPKMRLTDIAYDTKEEAEKLLKLVLDAYKETIKSK